jgi:hypothetical protein
LTEFARDPFAVFRELGLGPEVEVSVVGVDRHEEIMQEALEPGQPEGVGPRIAEPDRRVPGELVSAVSQCEAYASERAGSFQSADIELLGRGARKLNPGERGEFRAHPRP